MAPFIPKSIAAVESKGISILFYARSSGELTSLTAQVEGEESKSPYKSVDIRLNNNIVRAAAPQVAAFAYTHMKNEEIRLFFIGESQGSSNYIRELCKTNNDDWREGALSGNDLPITKDSPLSVDAEDDKTDYKVFYNGY
ncbi:MAG: hypothetical protein Q9214_005709 [Letrouitia sp. 1 TL-2023]